MKFFFLFLLFILTSVECVQDDLYYVLETEDILHTPASSDPSYYQSITKCYRSPLKHEYDGKLYRLNVGNYEIEFKVLTVVIGEHQTIYKVVCEDIEYEIKEIIFDGLLYLSVITLHDQDDRYSIRKKTLTVSHAKLCDYE